eukprot:4499435-Prymnesium_polylepis.1
MLLRLSRSVCDAQYLRSRSTGPRRTRALPRQLGARARTRAPRRPSEEVSGSGPRISKSEELSRKVSDSALCRGCRPRT